ncbi:DUF3558 domain-containing protein [Nocardia alni]|uniref:DUF3558 domain-containing protein n=1 Tax=Nocardia alni TaxID=2815723 RepID=UPI0020B392A1|nr:DUF3558 domain-containing protein [Nocardia alni]
MRTVAVVAGLCAVLAVAGCSKSQSGQPQAAATTTLSEAQIWDPCSLPDSAVAATGVDPSTKDTSGVGNGPGWKICGWNSDTYFMDVDATSHTLADVRANPHLTHQQDIEIDGRKAVTSREGDNTDDCGVDFATSKGVVEVVIRQSAGAATAGDYCAIAVRSVKALNQWIPQ